MPPKTKNTDITITIYNPETTEDYSRFSEPVEFYAIAIPKEKHNAKERNQGYSQTQNL